MYKLIRILFCLKIGHAALAAITGFHSTPESAASLVRDIAGVPQFTITASHQSGYTAKDSSPLYSTGTGNSTPRLLQPKTSLKSIPSYGCDNFGQFIFS